MSDLIVDKPNVKTLFHFGQYYCIQDGESYGVFLIDRASGRQELYGQPSLTLHRAWRQFWGAVDSAMIRRMDKIEENPGTGLWADPDEVGRYITCITSRVGREEYENWCLRVNGRPDSPLTEEQRIAFDLDIYRRYGGNGKFPPGLKWRLKTLMIQAGVQNEQKETHP